jgi:curved DNA-binding protein CbpA
VTTDQNHYEVLGVSEDASEGEIESAFYRKVKEHPPEQDEEGHKRVREAYDVLSNPDSRDEYDALLRSGGEIEELREEAERLLNRKDPDIDTAIKKLKKAVVLGPEIGVLRSKLGNAYLRNDQPRKALDQFDEAIDLDQETSPSQLMNRGHALREIERHSEAERDYRAVWEEDEGFYAAARGLASCLFEQDRVEEAHDVLDKAIWADDKLDFEDFFCYYDKLQLYVAEGEVDVLKEELETVKGLPETESDRKFAAYMLSQTSQMLAEGKVYSLAKDFIDTAVGLDPENPQLRAVQEFVRENALIEEEMESLVEDSSIHDFVKNVAAVFFQQFIGIIDERETKEQFDQINAGIQNIMQVDPDNTEIKKSIRRVRSQYSRVYDLNSEAFETILGMPEATDRVDDCPHCGEPIQFEKGIEELGQCSNCTKVILVTESNGIKRSPENEIRIHRRKKGDPDSIKDPSSLGESPKKGSSSGCFVATAVFGSRDHPDVVRLRRFRDKTLLKYRLGKAIVYIYYQYGPYIAHFIRGRENIKNYIRNSISSSVKIFLR